MRQERHNNPVKRTRTSQPEKQHVHSYKSVKEAVAHTRAAWTKRKALVRQNTQFDALRDKTLVIPPAKFTGQYKDIERFLEDIQQYLDKTEVTLPKRQVLIALSRMQDDRWVDTMRNAMTTLYDNIPYVWDQFVQQFKKHFT